MNFIIDFYVRARTLTVPLTLTIIVAIILRLTSNIDPNILTIGSWLATTIIVFGNLIYIVFSHSKERWPNQSIIRRFVRIMTFDRYK